MTETVGFTGTRRELTSDERFRVAGLVHYLPAGTRIVTGACIGLDAYVAAFAHQEGRHVHTIVPADRSRVAATWRAHCTTSELMPKGSSYRDRNIKVVQESDRLIAVPDHAEDAPESQRSGTWQTVRTARAAGKPVEVHVLCADCDPERRRRADAASAELREGDPG